MVAATAETPTPLLAQDYSAAPASFRAADFGGRRGALVISEGLASDNYSLVPARSVSLGKTGTAADLESGVYEVAKLGAAPVKVRDEAPNVASLIPTGDRLELQPYLVEGIGHVHTVVRDQKTGEIQTTCAVFTTTDGRLVALNVDFIPSDGAEHDSVGLRTFGRNPQVRWSLTADKDHPETRPTMFTRKAYSRSHQVGGGSGVYVSGEWQAVIMPVKLRAPAVS